ncbi:MAG TPA: polysaccharide biosynthesis/export family protein [Edaphobacter sp.]
MKRLWGFLVVGSLGVTIPSVAQTTTQPQPAAATTAPTAASVAAPAAPNTTTGDKTSAASHSVPIDPSTYVIGAEDVLVIQVWKEQQLSGTIPVRPDGMISLVLLGDVPAAGKTPMQLASEITTGLKKYITDPNVSVTVTGVGSHRVFMVGEVGHVGPIGLTAGMSPLQAIAAAGGLNAFANTKRIYILRGEQGKQQKIPFDYKGALKGTSKQNITLQPGDTIVVP